MKQTGILLYEGPSQLDGAPIVAIATFGSDNSKTGNVTQTWILRADVDPVAASKAALDSSVCGDCPHKHSAGGACYVTLFQAPLGVWRAYKRGAYARTEAAKTELAQVLDSGRMVRLGAYGDPAAVPADVWIDLLEHAHGGWTGYTHQWHNPVAKALQPLCMASVDSQAEAVLAQSQGWRTFQVIARGDNASDAPGIECLSESRGKSCAECRLCNGARAGLDPKQIASIWIDVHGNRSAKFQPKALKVIR